MLYWRGNENDYKTMSDFTDWYICYRCARHIRNTENYPLELFPRPDIEKVKNFLRGQGSGVDPREKIEIVRCRKCYDTFLYDSDFEVPDIWFSKIGKWKYLVQTILWIELILFVLITLAFPDMINERTWYWIPPLTILFIILSIMWSDRRKKRKRIFSAFLNALVNNGIHDSIRYVGRESEVYETDVYKKRSELKPKINKTATVLIYSIIPIVYIYIWNKHHGNL